MLSFDNWRRIKDDEGRIGYLACGSLDQIRELFPKVPLGAFCEAERHVGHRVPAAMFNVIFYQNIEPHCWITCWKCFKLLQQHASMG
jgi:hypothetical protein